jgi:hypothetical protein
LSAFKKESLPAFIVGFPAIVFTAKPYTAIEQVDRHPKNNPMQDIWHLSLTASKNAGKNLPTFLRACLLVNPGKSAEIFLNCF